MIVGFRKKATHAYVGVKDGRVVLVTADHGDNRTAEDVVEHIATGGFIERIPVAISEGLLDQKWPIGRRFNKQSA